MKTKLIKIGNSKGIVLPSKLLSKLAIYESQEVNITEFEGSILLKAAKSSREGWEMKIKEEITRSGPHVGLIQDVFEDDTLEDITW